jgi:hypothetical protein
MAVLLATATEVRTAKPSPDIPITVTYRCGISVPIPSPVPDCPGNGFPDAVRGDSEPYESFLLAIRELQLIIQPPQERLLWLDFTNGPPRQTGSRRDFDTLLLNDLVMTTNVVNTLGQDAEGGLTSIQIGGTSQSKVKIAFNRLNAVGQLIQWAVRFNPVDYPGSNFVTINRRSANEWVVEAVATDQAILESKISRKHGSELREGPFSMPFSLTIVSH